MYKEKIVKNDLSEEHRILINSEIATFNSDRKIIN